jgi:hypothetical protein
MLEMFWGENPNTIPLYKIRKMRGNQSFETFKRQERQ